MSHSNSKPVFYQLMKKTSESKGREVIYHKNNAVNNAAQIEFYQSLILQPLLIYKPVSRAFLNIGENNS